MTDKSTIKTAAVNPRVYAVVVSSKRGSILHLGIYYSLDDAYVAAKKELFMFTPHKETEGVEIDFWSSLDADSTINALVNGSPNNIVIREEKPRVIEKTILEQINDAKEQKNAIMKSILIKKDLGLLREAKSILSKSEIKFIEGKLLTKNKTC